MKLSAAHKNITESLIFLREKFLLEFKKIFMIQIEFCGA